MFLFAGGIMSSQAAAVSEAASVSQVLRWHTCMRTRLNPFAPGDFCQKMCFEASRVVFWSLSCYKELKLTTNRFAGRTLGGLLIQMQNISLRSSGMRRKQNFSFSPPPLFFRFSCWAFSMLHFGRKGF